MINMGYYEELRTVHQGILELDKTISTEERELKKNHLLTAMQLVCDLAELARREGLLALEEAVETREAGIGTEYLKKLILLVVDGTEREDIKKIAMTRYASSLVRDYEALIYLMYLEGALLIQAGENLRLVEEKMKAFLPNGLYEMYGELQEAKLKAEQKEQEENIIERLCKGKKFWNPKDSGYFVMKLADYTICDISDKALSRLMREVDNMDLALAMKGLSGDARKHIFNCLSERLGKMIAEDMEYMGPVRAVDVLEATQKIIMILIRLIERGEVVGCYDYLVPFFDMFCVDVKEKNDKSSKFEELKNIMKEYEKMEKHKVE